jgi:hypothetical protein
MQFDGLTTGSELLDGAFWVSKSGNLKTHNYPFNGGYFELHNDGKLFCCDVVFGRDKSKTRKMPIEGFSIAELEDLMMRCSEGAIMFKRGIFCGVSVDYCFPYFLVDNLHHFRYFSKKIFTEKELNAMFLAFEARAGSVRIMIKGSAHILADILYIIRYMLDEPTKIRLENDRELNYTGIMTISEFLKCRDDMVNYIITGKFDERFVTKPGKKALF